MPWLRRVVQQALYYGAHAASIDANSPSSSYGLSLVIADDETVRRLNSDYRGLDETTDVLAFALYQPSHYEGDGTPQLSSIQEQFIIAREGKCFIGEVIVSYPQCLRQANAQGHNASQELALLITHGVLHLLGYDHASTEDERAMKAREKLTLVAAEVCP